MTELLTQHTRNKRALKKVITKEILEKIPTYVAIPHDHITEEELLEAQSLRETLKESVNELKNLNEKIINLMTEERDIEAEMEDAVVFDLLTKKNMMKWRQP